MMPYCLFIIIMNCLENRPARSLCLPNYTSLLIFFFQLISSRLIFPIPIALRPAFNKPLKVEFKTEKYDKTEFEL